MSAQQNAELLSWLVWRITSNQDSIARGLLRFEEKHGQLPNRALVSTAWSPERLAILQEQARAVGCWDLAILSDSRIFAPDEIWLAYDDKIQPEIDGKASQLAFDFVSK